MYDERMMGQGELFGIFEVDRSLVTEICQILGFDPEIWGVDDPSQWEEIDDFICDAVRDYIRRYAPWNS